MIKAFNAMCGIAALGIFAAGANAQVIEGSYDWEDGGTALGQYGDNLHLENSTEQAYDGSASLRMFESPEDGTPQAYVAFIENLTDDDIITAGFWCYDTTEGASPSGRIWGHYAQSGDIEAYAGSASGNTTYSDGLGWSYLEWTWTFDSDGGTRDSLVVEARIYADNLPETDDIIWIDAINVYVESSTGNATLTFPGSGSGPGYALETSDLIGGEIGQFLITGGTPDGRQFLAYSLRGLGNTPVPQLGIELDLNNPSLGARGVADANGDALLSTNIPAAGSGHTVWLQACENGNTTNVVEEYID